MKHAAVNASLVSFWNAVAVLSPSAVLAWSLQPGQPTALCQSWQGDSLTAGLAAAEIDLASGKSNGNNDSNSFSATRNNENTTDKKKTNILVNKCNI